MWLFIPENIGRMTPERARVLYNTTITEQTPGSILHDFNALLNFIAESEPQLTEQKQLFSLRTLSPLNQLMTRPMAHGLKRPMQISFPYLDGLFLLVRASGLTYVEGEQKPYLVVDPEVKQSWDSLNPVEQYCYLLETWLVRGNESIVGEDRCLFSNRPPIDRVFSFFHRMPAEGINVGGTVLADLKYHPGLRHLALLELFGFVTIESGEAEPGKGWQPETIQATPLGDAMLILVIHWFGDQENLLKLELPFAQTVGELQPLLQSYFPEWQNNLSLPHHSFREGLHTFKVSLDTNVWRRISIPADYSLDALSNAILSAFDFDNDHLYQYIIPTRYGTRDTVLHSYMVEAYGDSAVYTSDVCVGDLPLPLHSSMLFNFDFGDNWYFSVTLEQIDASLSKAALKKSEPKIIETKGDAPEQYPI